MKAKLLVFSLASIGRTELLSPILTKPNMYLLKKLQLIRMLFYLERVLRKLEPIPDTVNFKPLPRRYHLKYSHK